MVRAASPRRPKPGRKLLVAPPISYVASVQQPEEPGDGNYIAALARGLTVIRAFSYQHDRLTLAELARLVDLPRATVRRCLITLASLGYVESDGKYFSLSPKILTLSRAYFSSNTLPHIARPIIEEMSHAVDESCSLSVLAGDEIIYVARSTLKRSASIHRDVGVNLPAYCTSMGRVLLANLSEEHLDGYFSRVVLKRYSSKTVVEEAKLRTILARVRQQDFAVIDGELEPNLLAIAVPVRNREGTVVAAAHISSTSERGSIDRLKRELLPVLRDAAAQIRQALI